MAAHLEQALPIVNATDLQFQFVVEAENIAEYLVLLGMDETNAVIKMPDGTVCLTDVTLCRLGYYFIFQFSGSLVLTGITDCFDLHLFLNIPGSDGAVEYVSNLFSITTDQKYTSLITFYSDENSNGFYYCCDQTNKIRLPLYLLQPQWIDDEEVYLKSNGERKVLYSVTSKTYDCITDYYDQDLHEKTKVLLGSDHINIISRIYTGNIVKTDAYNVAWPARIDSGTASFKVYASPLDIQNTNCDICLGECDLAVTGLTTEPVAQNPGDPVIYQASYILSGTASDILVQYLLDDSLWADATVHGVYFGHLLYDIGREDDTPHTLRIIPLCAPNDPGLPTEFEYTIAGDGLCPVTIDTLNLCEDCGTQFTVVWEFLGDAPAEWEIVIDGGSPTVKTDVECGGSAGNVRFYNFGTGYVMADYTITVRAKCGTNFGALATVTEGYDPAGTGGTGGGINLTMTYDNGDNGFKLKSIWKQGATTVHDGGLEDGNPNPLVIPSAIDSGTYTVSINGHPGIGQCFIICPTNALNRKVILHPTTGHSLIDQTIKINGNVTIEY